MTLRRRFAVLLLTALFASAPALALAADDCGACCCPPPPCHASAPDCETSLADAPCCDEASAAAALPIKRSVEAPSLHAPPAARTAAPTGPSAGRAPLRAGDLPHRVSPLRLSVVLLI